MGFPEPYPATSVSARRVAGPSLALVLIGLSGCTIVQMRGDLQERQTRIDEKQQQLDDLHATNTELAAESDRLKNDLQQHELNAKELRARLDKLIKLNAAARVSSARQQGEQQERSRQLEAISQQAQALDQNTSLTDEEKEKKLEALRDRTRELLKILLAG